MSDHWDGDHLSRFYLVKPDLSVMLCFLFWDVVYVDRIPGRTIEDQDQEGSKRTAAQKRLVGSSEPGEIRGCFVGIAHSVGLSLIHI